MVLILTVCIEISPERKDCGTNILVFSSKSVQSVWIEQQLTSENKADH